MGQNSEDVKVNVPYMVISWAWAVIPLGWGILQTIHKAAALFQ